MWIEIKNDVFETKDSKGLNFLLQLLTWSPSNSVPRYNVFIDSRKIVKSDNYLRLSYDDKKLLDDEFDAFVLTNANSNFLISNKSIGDNVYSLEEAIRFFIQPISIILENSKNDAAFVKAIVIHFENKTVNGYQLIDEHIKNGWIQFENAGGCGNVFNFIEGKLQSFNDMALRNRRENWQYLRCMVILDSDKEYPSQPRKQDYINLEQFFNRTGIHYHILEKRMMENYMPDEVFSDLKNKTTEAWINVYDNLTPSQKDYLNYRSGFSKEKDEHGVRKPIKNEVSNLYNLSQPNFDSLDKGFAYADFKNSFPNLFLTNSRINKYTMKNRAGNDELENILEKIGRLI